MGWSWVRKSKVRGRTLRWAAPLMAAVGVLSVSAAAAGSAPRVSRPGTAALEVIPFPGTPDASPDSQIIFSTLRPSELGAVTVTGSRSGRHDGRISALPGGAGAAFAPARPFSPGERITVNARLRSRAAGAAAGDPGANRLGFTFTVALPVKQTPGASSGAAGDARAAGWQVYHSEPHLHPPLVSESPRGDPTAGDIFLTPHNVGQTGPMIVNGRGQLVWFLQTGRITPFNFELQHYQGQPVLTWWQGHLHMGHGVDGQDWIMNSHYGKVAVLHGGYGYSSDLHEFQLMPHGRALIDCYVPVHASETSVGGPSDGVVVDNVIQELDIHTGRVLWEWHALGHIPLTATYNWIPSDQFPLDYFHINSIEPLPDGRLIISARNTWSVYMLDMHTGRVVWTLGGKDSNFNMGPGTNFEWQHDARLDRHGILTLFDDAAVPQEESESSAKVMRIDVQTGVVSLVHRFTHSPSLLAGSQGSVQILPDGNYFVGWGSAPNFSEYTPSGRQIFDGRFRLGVNTYRAYRYRWTGRPQTRPSLAVSSGRHGGVRLYASWNGATQVASWRALGGATRHKLRPLGKFRARGFETGMRLHRQARFYAVQALNAGGRLLGRSYLILNPSRAASASWTG
jgi:outer membrane protein assembly factor BamB